ncbi:hypothetical protein ACSQ67_015088 [Phaseolus vulgaris]
MFKEESSCRIGCWSSGHWLASLLLSSKSLAKNYRIVLLQYFSVLSQLDPFDWTEKRTQSCWSQFGSLCVVTDADEQPSRLLLLIPKMSSDSVLALLHGSWRCEVGINNRRLHD